uniref:Uncharacterized protein n=1 Tax=Aegilops tauschii subsp. strangulata TaxID=200361 RepID=A0A452Z554_AEGTS
SSNIIRSNDVLCKFDYKSPQISLLRTKSSMVNNSLTSVQQRKANTLSEAQLRLVRHTIIRTSHTKKSAAAT